MHILHVLLPLLLLRGRGQGMHGEAGLLEYDPAGQGLQSPLLFAPVSRRVVPAGQLWHADRSSEPWSGLKVPGGQAIHTRAVEAPSTEQ